MAGEERLARARGSHGLSLPDAARLTKGSAGVLGVVRARTSASAWYSQSMAERRRPAWVFRGGEDPDPRFSLANERTFLAWIRTTLGLLAGAAAVDALDLPMSRGLQQSVAVILAGTAVVASVQAYLGWARTERAMRVGRPLPSNPAQVVVVLAVAVVAFVLVGASLGRG